MQIALTGAGGQVGAEVALRLSSNPGVVLVPIARDRQSSAFLRYSGVAVAHGAVTDAAFAMAAFKDCDVVANFALASGTPAAAGRENAALTKSIFDSTSPSTTLVFFSSLAADGTTQADGQRRRDFYSDLKRKHEKQVLDLARRHNRKAIVYRLGHVMGDYQGFSAACKAELESGPITIPDPDRLSNTTHTVAICEALFKSAQTPQLHASVYDLVNTPQWNWREVYRHVSGGNEPEFCVVPMSAPRSRAFNPMGWAIRLRPLVTRGLGHLPERFNRRVRADYFVRRAANEVAMLNRAVVVSNAASYWSGHDVHGLPARNTLELIQNGSWKLPETPRKQWPDDLAISGNGDA
jgi:nucleoside-diphosphate-sugar epimerase